jgi:hypothetical protein
VIAYGNAFGGKTRLSEGPAEGVWDGKSTIIFDLTDITMQNCDLKAAEVILGMLQDGYPER